MNKVVLMGRLTRDPEIRLSQGNEPISIANFTLAVDRRFKKDEADFIPCKAFRKQAEFAEKYLRKGTKVMVCGSIQTGSYTGRDGTKKYTTDVLCDEIEFAESKRAESGSQYTQPEPNGGFVPVGDDDVPFK